MDCGRRASKTMRFCASSVMFHTFSIVLLSLLFNHGVTAAATNTDTILTVPAILYTDRENLIFVRTAHPNTRVSVSTHMHRLSEIPQDTTVYESKRVQAEWHEITIPYHVPFLLVTEQAFARLTLNFTLTHCASDACDQFTQQFLSESVSVLPPPVRLLGETDKPVYRPGETVRFRFLPLTPNLLWPHTSPVSRDTKKKLIIKEDFTMELLDLTEADAKIRQVSLMTYEEISVNDASDNRVKQWLNVSLAEAFLLNYTLLADAPVGAWSVTARLPTVSHTAVEKLQFTVKPYVLPRFTVTVEHPKQMSLESRHVQFAVCARYTNGPPLSGSVRAHLCVCSKEDSESATNQAAMLEDQACAAPRWRSDRRPCVPVHGLLSPVDGCAQFNVSTNVLALSDSSYPRWRQVPVICAHVEEQGTGMNVSRCEPGSEQLLREQAQLEITVPGAYKRDLPLVGTVQLTNLETPNPENFTIRLLAEELQPYCFYRSPARASRDLYRHTQLLRTDRNGVASFVIPPIRGNRSLVLKAIVDHDSIVPVASETSGVESTTTLHAVVQPRSSPPRPPVKIIGQKIVERWLTPGNLSMTVWPSVDDVEVKCPGQVQVQLLANTPLEPRTLHVQTVVRGQHLSHVIPPSNQPDPCVDRDDRLGHYRCLGSADSEEIECLPGWSGDNCLIPTCVQGCSSPGGVCSAPDQCTCFEHWSGSQCDQCTNPDKCDRAAVEIEQIRVDDSATPAPTRQSESVPMGPATGPDTEPPKIQPNETKPKRTLHLRNISFPVDGNWGPEATVVIFFLDQTDSGSDLVPVNVALKNMSMCTSPSTAMEASHVQAGLSLSQRKVSPGQEITLKLVPRGLDQPDVKSETPTEQTCFVRMQDISLDNFEGKKNLIDLSVISKLVDDRTSHFRSAEADSVDQAFRVAGIQMMSTVSFEVVRPMPCPYIVYNNAVDSAAVPGPGWLARTSPIVSDFMEKEGSMPAQKPRLRDFFPEVWLFDHYPIEWSRPSGVVDHGGKMQGLVQKALTVPDTITSWRANAFCTTASNGLWIPQAVELTVTMPFFVEITLPKQVKRGEILYLPISVFVSRRVEEEEEDREANRTSAMDNDCPAVYVQAELDPADWIAIGNQAYTDCVCPGEKRTFQLGMMARRLGALNVTVEAHAQTNTVLCSNNEVEWSENGTSRTFSDRIRRAIIVEPEGIRQDVVLGDILCLTEDSPFAKAVFPVSLPSVPVLVPDSLRIYLTYSDEVLGPALANPDRLVRLPTGCGEQNMVLVAPNVYILDYFGATTETFASSAVQKLTRAARTHILMGYQRQLNYRREDGSYSAFGKSDAEGSTWLTAFVLRVFTKACRVDHYLQIDWDTLFDETLEFLKRRQNITTGCFYELGRVLHSGMQGTVGTGDVNEKTVLLTAYILSTILENKRKVGLPLSPELTTIIQSGLKCLHEVHGLNRFDNVAHLSTYALAQLAYTLALHDPQSQLASMYQQELVRRQQHRNAQGLTQSIRYWLARESTESIVHKIGALDVETTSYAVLTLNKLGVSTNELFPVVRWLSSQQKLEGGFFSTQDTVLGLEAIAEFAKRLRKTIQSNDSTPLEVEARLFPSQYTLKDSVTAEKQHVSNQFAVPKDLDPSQLKHVSWNVSSAAPRQGCLAVHTSLIYNVADSDEPKQSMILITSTVTQAHEPPVNACTTAALSICLRPNIFNPQTTGMLLLKVTMQSGWKPVPTEILQQVRGDSDSARQIEFAHDDTVSVYFDGFSADQEGSSDWAQTAKRCVKLSLEQIAYVKNAKPAQIEAMDYYATDTRLSTRYSLDACPGAWHMESDASGATSTSETSTTEWSTATPKQLYCPSCTLDDNQKNVLMENLLQYVCNGWSNLMAIKVHRSTGQGHEVTFSSIGPGTQVSSWNSTLITQDTLSCSCAALKSNASLIWISPRSELPGEPGDRQVPIQSFDEQALIVPISEAWPAIDAARTKWKTRKMNETTPSGLRPLFPPSACSRIDILWRYIKSKLL